MPAHPFIEQWQNSAAAERANYQLFLSELCDYLEIPRPDPTVADDRENHYVFERSVMFRHPTGLTSSRFIDLYKRGCFVLEAKQGSEVADTPLLFAPPRRRGCRRGWDERLGRSNAPRPQSGRAIRKGVAGDRGVAAFPDRG
jgi:hypothetical protein